MITQVIVAPEAPALAASCDRACMHRCDHRLTTTIPFEEG
jgi:hypothetical protein